MASNPKNVSCPFLPPIAHQLRPSHTRRLRDECGLAYYVACLELAQSMLQLGKPAQAILQLNKSMMALIPSDHSILSSHPIPYLGMQWIMINHHKKSDFIGNPVRHFQHLASRMSPISPQPELRVWRAWTCFHLARNILPSIDYPLDRKQIEKEQLTIPGCNETWTNLARLSPHNSEIEQTKKLLL